MEILRFGPGHRRLGGPPGTQNVEGAVIMSDDRAIVSELALGRYAMVVPHENPDNTALFIVISGAGWVQVGEERARINHGEAVVWPAGELHGAYTDGTEMRAIVVELTGNPPELIEGVRAFDARRGRRIRCGHGATQIRPKRRRTARLPSARSRVTNMTLQRVSPGSADG